MSYRDFLHLCASGMFSRAMNFGGIGVVIGHELTHAFDDQGKEIIFLKITFCKVCVSKCHLPIRQI